MSSPSGPLRAALEPWLRADTGVRTAFGSKPVKVFQTLPPVNATAPYIFLAGFSELDDIAECLDATEIELQVDVWSLMSPPGFAEAETIAAAVKAALLRIPTEGDSPAFTISGFRVVSSQPISTDFLTDPADGKTVHAVIRLRYAIDPT